MNQPTSKTQETALALFKEGFSCSQAVFAAFAQPQLDTRLALKIADSFGGGMGVANACGAVTGSLMVIGLYYGREHANDQTAKEKKRDLARSFITEFTQNFNSIECKNLLGYDISTPEGGKEASKKGLFDSLCPQFILHATTILEKILAENPVN